LLLRHSAHLLLQAGIKVLRQRLLRFFMLLLPLLLLSAVAVCNTLVHNSLAIIVCVQTALTVRWCPWWHHRHWHGHVRQTYSYEEFTERVWRLHPPVEGVAAAVTVAA